MERTFVLQKLNVLFRKDKIMCGSSHGQTAGTGITVNKTGGLRLGIGNGSLAASVCWMLNQIGVQCDPTTRAAWQDTGNELVEKIFISRPQHIITALYSGDVDGIIAGSDMLQEYAKAKDDFSTSRPLPVSKTTRTCNAHVVAFVCDESPCRTVRDLEGCTILSEYPTLTRRWLDYWKVSASICFPLAAPRV
jgi:ATP phosphoribosyltransferase